MQGISQTSCSQPQFIAHLFLKSHSSSLTQGHSPPMQDTCPPLQGTRPHMQGISVPTHSFSPLTQGTSHPPSLPPNRGHPFCYTYDKNFPSTSDIVKRTANLQKPLETLSKQVPLLIWQTTPAKPTLWSPLLSQHPQLQREFTGHPVFLQSHSKGQMLLLLTSPRSKGCSAQIPI